MKKLAIVVSHPIQYHAPLFKKVANIIDFKVFYCFQPTAGEQGKDGFGKAFKWDIDLLEGYEYEFLNNVSKQPSSSRRDGCDTPEIGQRLSEWNPSHVIIFGWNLKSYLQALKYCKTNKIPVAVRGDSQTDPNQSVVKRVVKRLYYPFFLGQFTKFLSVGKRNKEYLKSFGIKEKDIIFSPHAVDQSFWKVDKIKKEEINFLWVGKFIDKKKPLEVIQAFIDATTEEDGSYLNMVGSGKLLEECKELAQYRSDILFLGFKNQTELKEEYSKADCLILASDYQETWGLVVNEAFSAGVPAIVSSACGCSEDLINEGTGVVFEFGNSNALKMGISSMKSKIEVKEEYNDIQEVNAIYHYDNIVRSFQTFMNETRKV